MSCLDTVTHEHDALVHCGREKGEAEESRGEEEEEGRERGEQGRGKRGARERKRGGRGRNVQQTSIESNSMHM